MKRIGWWWWVLVAQVTGAISYSPHLEWMSQLLCSGVLLRHSHHIHLFKTGGVDDSLPLACRTVIPDATCFITDSSEQYAVECLV